MTKRTHLLQEYDLIYETMPILLVSMLLNVAGRQLAASADVQVVFFDMVGTALCAILLGPWWAATVAAASSTINGNFSGIYFVFGVVNIAGGVTWGYFARAVGGKGKIASADPRQWLRMLLFGAGFALAGGTVCGLASSAVKHVLYPAMGRPLVKNVFEKGTRDAVARALGAAPPDALSLLATDLWRDLLDKALVTAAALAAIILLRHGPPSISAASRHTRLRVDLPSVVVFISTYAVYLLLARIITPTVSIAGAGVAVAWMSDVRFVILLFAPVVVAALVVILLTYRTSDRDACAIELDRQQRSRVYRRIFRAPIAQGTSLAKYFATRALTANDWLNRISVQPLSIAVTVWSLRSVLGVQFSGAAALGVVGTAVVLYFVAARRIFSRVRLACERDRIVRGWLTLGSGLDDAVPVLTVLTDQVGNQIAVAEGLPFHRGGVVFVVGPVTANDVAPYAVRVGIAAVLTGPGALDAPVARALRQLTADFGATLLAVAATASSLHDPDVRSVLRDLHVGGVQIELFDWIALEDAAPRALGGRGEVSATRAAHMRFLRTLATGIEEVRPTDPTREARWLVQRALSTVRHLLSELPRGSRVFDLGCGFGRHSIAAVLSGHDVVSIDRKPEVCATLRGHLAGLKVNGAVVLDGDFTDLTAKDHGYADLVLLLGVLQHAADEAELVRWLRHAAGLAAFPGSLVYIEMLFDMRFDGAPAAGRVAIDVPGFELMLRTCFPAGTWQIEVTQGPQRQLQSFADGPRSFDTTGFREVESTVVEYGARRLA